MIPRPEAMDRAPLGATDADLQAWAEEGRRHGQALEVLWHAQAVAEQGGAFEDCPFDGRAHPVAAARWRDHFAICREAALQRQAEADELAALKQRWGYADP